jgi:hypothetical protein
MMIAKSASAFHLDLPCFGAIGVGATGWVGWAGTTALAEGESTSPCLIST